MGLKQDKKHQDGHKKDIKTLKVQKKQHFQKMLFSHAKTIHFEFWRLPRRPQDEPKRLREAPKRHLKSLKTSKKVYKNDPHKYYFWG